MVFSSISFLLYFLPIIMIFYYASRSRIYRNTVLVLGSLFFYAWGEPVWVVLLIFTAILDYHCGRAMENARTDRGRKIALMVSVVTNLSILAFFKYQGFLIENINSIFNLDLSYHSFALPIGISFYTFQTMSYTIDVYRRRTVAQKSFWDFLLFVSLFPQLVAGPIVRYVDIESQIKDRHESIDSFAAGIRRFSLGLGKKVIIGNTIGQIALVYANANPENISSVAAWLAILLSIFQYYYDFSGYSDMAIGLGKMMGFNIKENFLHPLTSKSISELWTRWHISLMVFFKEYVYIPLGGNRKNYAFNIIFVFALSGLWHAPTWGFVLWGLISALFILMEKYFLGKYLEKLPVPIRIAYTIVVFSTSLFLGVGESFAHNVSIIKTAYGFGGTGFIDYRTISFIASNIFIIILSFIGLFPILNMSKRFLSTKLKAKDASITAISSIGALGFIAISIVLIVAQGYNPFLYFRF